MFHKPGVQILFLSLAVTLALVAGNLVFAERKQDIPELSKKLRKYDVLKLDPKSTASQIRRTGKLVLKTSDRVFDLQLVPHDLRSHDYRSQVIGSDGVARSLPRDPVNTYKGFVSDMNTAQVRMTITDDSIEGAIITSNGRYFIQPARSLSKTASKDEFVFYNSQDLTHDDGMWSAILADQVAVEQERASGYVEKASTGELNASNIAPLNPRKLVRLATEVDAEYVASLGGESQANNHVLSIMNQVDGLYEAEFGITFQIVFQNAWTNAATDPYTSLERIALAAEFRNHWDANFGNIQRDLAHFWSGKDLPVPGSAYFAVVCRVPEDAYGFSGRMPFDPANPITPSTIWLTAHELGHNFGAIHPGPPDVQPEIAANCIGSIMIGGSLTTFCPYSRSEIIGFTNSFATCLADATTPPPAHPTCVDVPINPGVAVSGTLAPTDCRSPLRGVRYFADRYSFDGQAGQRLTITMNSASPGLEAFVFLIGPDGFIAAQDAFNGGGNNARIPMTGTFTLPFTGKYVIEATSFGEQTGNYTLNVSPAGCVLSVNPSGQHFASSGGDGTINVTATGSNCSPGYQFTVWPNTTTWLQTKVLNGEGSQSLGFTVDANANLPGRRAFLIVGASAGTQTGGLSIAITQSGTGPDCVLTPIAFGETINGALGPTDCRSPIGGGNFAFADRYVFTATADQEVAVLASPAGVTSLLTLLGPNGRIILTDAGGGAAFHSRIPGGNGTLKLGFSGQYVIEVTSATPGFIAPYTLTLVNNEPPVVFAEDGSDSAIALESVSMLRDPFPLTTPFNLSVDQQTRLMLFAENLALQPGENQSVVTAVAEDSLMNSYPLTVEFVGKVPGFGRLTQIVVKLPSNLPLGQEVRVNVTVRGKTSNKVRVRIK